MKDFDVMTISKVGQANFPKAWRQTAGLELGGVVEVRFLKDGSQSLLLTPKPRKRTGAVGLLQATQSCPVELPEVGRDPLPSK